MQYSAGFFELAAGVLAGVMIFRGLYSCYTKAGNRFLRNNNVEVPAGIAPAYGGFADPCLTAWRRHHERKDRRYILTLLALSEVEGLLGDGTKAARVY